MWKDLIPQSAPGHQPHALRNFRSTLATTEVDFHQPHVLRGFCEGQDPFASQAVASRADNSIPEKLFHGKKIANSPFSRLSPQFSDLYLGQHCHLAV
jgi:hypothetical protein